ncbi:MAG TPA: hypothetical protein PLL10_02850 [Elusimicrobiales bacterium]|nr:hypothetical protein [Elusimicrobiales bacterium]
MAEEYVVSAELSCNGQSITDIKSVSEREVEYRRLVNLMNKTGVVDVKPRYQVTVDYVLPKNKPPFDWSGVKNGTLLVRLSNGRTISFTGVSTLKLGERKIDGENEVTQPIDLMAGERVES